MRQGNIFSQWIKHHQDEGAYCPVPWEVAEAFGGDYVIWKDNGDGTYTLTPTKE